MPRRSVHNYGGAKVSGLLVLIAIGFGGLIMRELSTTHTGRARPGLVPASCDHVTYSGWNGQTTSRRDPRSRGRAVGVGLGPRRVGIYLGLISCIFYAMPFLICLDSESGR